MLVISAYRCYQAALRYATKCALMGGAWTRFNSMTERLEFLHFRVKFIDRFTKSWDSTKKRIEEGGDEEEEDDQEIKISCAARFWFLDFP